MRRLSLYQRLSFTLFIVFIAITLVFILWWQQVEQQTRQESEQRLHLSLAANLARDNPLLQQGIYDHEALENLFHTLMVLGPAFEFYFVDPDGKILTYSAESSLVKRQKISLEPIHLLIQNKALLPIYGDDPKHLSRQKVFSAAPVFNGTSLQGYLYVIVAGERYQHAFENVQQAQQVKVSILLIIVSLVFLFFVMLWLFRGITMPIRQLTKQMALFQSSGFSLASIQQPALLVKNELAKNDNEVAQLSQVFNDMAKKIDQQLAQLSQADKKRQALLTEISHDLRTPLASLTGYIEVIAIQGEKLSSDKRQEYIETALKNACQLNHLIDQIFELAHIESGQTAVHFEPFNLIEWLYDVVAKFKIKAEHSGVTLQINTTADNIFVCSDIGKLERVLSNLIDNAIRHTQAGGEVCCFVEKLNSQQISLKVSDNGSGIKKEELAYIFDARYRASNATTGKHSGLGLAISKKLCQLLKADLSVTSVIGKGSEFSLILPEGGSKGK